MESPSDLRDLEPVLVEEPGGRLQHQFLRLVELLVGHPNSFLAVAGELDRCLEDVVFDSLDVILVHEIALEKKLGQSPIFNDVLD